MWEAFQEKHKNQALNPSSDTASLILLIISLFTDFFTSLNYKLILDPTQRLTSQARFLHSSLTCNGTASSLPFTPEPVSTFAQKVAIPAAAKHIATPQKTSAGVDDTVLE